MYRVICFTLTVVLCVSIFSGCSKEENNSLSIYNQISENITTTKAIEKNRTSQTTEKNTAAQTTEKTTATQTTEKITATQTTEYVREIVSCSVCHRGYSGMNFVDGQCEKCRNGLCSWCGGPVGPNHNCNDYPNVVCPNPDCDWGIFTTGVGIEGIVCPKCGTRCV